MISNTLYDSHTTTELVIWERPPAATSFNIRSQPTVKHKGWHIFPRIFNLIQNIPPKHQYVSEEIIYELGFFLTFLAWNFTTVFRIQQFILFNINCNAIKWRTINNVHSRREWLLVKGLVDINKKWLIYPFSSSVHTLW